MSHIINLASLFETALNTWTSDSAFSYKMLLQIAIKCLTPNLPYRLN